MAAAKIYLSKILNYTYFKFLTLASCFGEKCKDTALALNFIQKQYFS